MTIDDLIARMQKSNLYNHLYHFTDKANFQSIDTHGLLSKEKLREMDLWPPPEPGGNEWSHSQDSIRGIDPYVSLCMTTNHGMVYLAKKEGRLPNPYYLKISPQVLHLKDVKISLGVANSVEVEILPLSQGIAKLDFDVLYTRTNWNDSEIRKRLQDVRKYEVLIPNHVPRNFIVGAMKK